MTILVFLIDEHRPTREILARRLASIPGLDVVRSTSDGESAIREIAGLSSDVVLIETKMKRSDGIDICRRALAADDQTTVAVLTSYLDPDERRLAYQAGVDGYLLKDVGTSDLADWIKLAVQQDSGDAESNDT
jgi:DNA-binding NarL/FixJ family response regulator